MSKRFKSLLRQSLARKALAVILALGVSLPFIGCANAEFDAAQKKEIETVVRDYLLSHPELLSEVMATLDQRQKDAEQQARQATLKDQDDIIYRSAYQSTVGNPDGKVTLVEFFDYNCGYCRSTLPDLAKLMKSNPDLRIILKDFPVLGPDSVEASQVAIAVRQQLKGDKYWEFHSRLLGSRGHVGKKQALDIARDLGVDMNKLDTDMQAADVKASIREVSTLAEGLNLTGTPSFVLGNEVVVGAIGYDALQTQINNLKKCGKNDCG